MIGLLCTILNVIFIYFGMKIGWYGGESSALRVISIGEGIISGVLYILLASIVMFQLSGKLPRKIAIIICNVFIMIISLTLSIATACQIGMVEEFFPSHVTEQLQVNEDLKDRGDQMAVLAVAIAAHAVALLSGL